MIGSRNADPDKQVSVKPMELKGHGESVGEIGSLRRSIPARLLIGPLGFLRSLLTFACISLPLIWMEGAFNRRAGTLVAHLGYAILYFIWVFKVLGRFADSGRLSNWYWFPFCIAVTVASALLVWFGLLNRYETLAVFLLLQIPLAFLASIFRPEEAVRRVSAGEKYRQSVARRRGRVEPLVVGASAFLQRLLVIGVLWAALIFMSASGGRILGWIARSGYAILAFAWVMNVTGRFEDAGWAHNWYPSQYTLVISVASLMPLAVHWVNGYGALAIFFFIQIPTMFLKSKAGGPGPNAVSKRH